jgi:hypothetical protein
MKSAWILVAATAILAAGCSTQKTVRELAHFSLDGTDGVIAQSDVSLDPLVSADGKGSLQVKAGLPTVVRLFEVAGVDYDLKRLSYQARLRTADVDGPVYLEMWCRFPGQGEYFSRALYAPLTGSNDWTSQSTDFMLEHGQRPDLVRLNLVVDGKGTAWIDDVRLLGTPM